MTKALGYLRWAFGGVLEASSSKDENFDVFQVADHGKYVDKAAMRR